MKSSAGFTLIEVLIAMLVSLVIMGGAYTFFNTQQRQTTIQTNVSDAQQTLRAAMDFVARDIRMAGYDPDNTGNFGITDIRLDANGISTITFTWDENDDGNLDGNETFSYSIADMPIGDPDGTIDLARAVGGGGRQLLAANITTLGFAYAYDANDDGKLDFDAADEIIWSVDNNGTWDSLTVDQSTGTATLVATGTNIDERTIRAVRIWMLAQSQAPDPNYTDTKTYVVGPHVVTPNNNFRHRLLERTVLCRNLGL